MLSIEGNESGKKRSNQQKSNCARAAHLFDSFLCRCFTRLKRETSRNFLVTRFIEGRVLVHSFFTVAHFHSGGRQHPAATRCHVFPPKKKISFCFFPIALAPFLVELRWLVALLQLFSLSFFFSIFQICGHDS